MIWESEGTENLMRQYNDTVLNTKTYTFIEAISIADSIRETERFKPDLRDRFMAASDW